MAALCPIHVLPRAMPLRGFSRNGMSGESMTCSSSLGKSQHALPPSRKGMAPGDEHDPRGKTQ
jgi:hypothetical protein